MVRGRGGILRDRGQGYGSIMYYAPMESGVVGSRTSRCYDMIYSDHGRPFPFRSPFILYPDSTRQKEDGE